jgi:hypothetical protein
VVVRKAQVATYLHVDDVIVLADRTCNNEVAWQSDVWMNTIADGMVDVGFVVTDRRGDADVDKVIGYVPERDPARIVLPGRKAALLYNAMDALVSLHTVDTKILHSLLGLWIWCALLRRDVLAIPQALFKFIERYPDDLVAWWPSARREFYCMAKVLPLIFADISAPVASTLFATDAMGANKVDDGGYGIVAADVDHEAALSTYSDGMACGFTVARRDGDLSGLRRPERAINRTVPFTKLPEALFSDATKWHDVAAGRWNYADHITLGESRTVVRLVQILAKDARCHDHKVLSLQDNKPTQGAMMKGRSPASSLNYVLRRKTASCLAAGLRLLLPWVESDKMPADFLSRLQTCSRD